MGFWRLSRGLLVHAPRPESDCVGPLFIRVLYDSPQNPQVVMTHTKLIDNLAQRITGIRLDHPVRVGIDGIDTAGKTTFADNLAEALENTIRASGDDFHNPREIRYRQGRESATGYYQDVFNYTAILEYLLKPFGPGGDLKYKPAY